MPKFPVDAPKLRSICTQARIPREEFLRAYEES
jgi:hypothetical protein